MNKLFKRCKKLKEGFDIGINFEVCTECRRNETKKEKKVQKKLK